MPESVDEASLLAAISQGDRAAAEELVDRTYPKIFALLLQLTADRELAADLTQEAFRKAWGALPAFDGRAQLSTWLYRIAYNQFLTHVRRTGRVVALDGEVAERIPDQHAGAEEEIETSERGARLRRAVLALPEELRCVVVARYWVGAPIADIAALERVTEVAIRKRLRRALDRLAAAISQERP